MLKLVVSGDVYVEDVVVGNDVYERLDQVLSLGVIIILSNINHLKYESCVYLASHKMISDKDTQFTSKISNSYFTLNKTLVLV